MHLHTPDGPLGIGGPTPNNTVYVLNEHLKPVKIGDMGIMWAGGAGITRGYLNLPDKTGEKYQRDPFLDDGSYMFNTGDLGRWLPDGDLEHLGRVDHQVKVKGFRVELDGVAAAMETTAGVKVATAILIAGELWGFYTPKSVSGDDVKAAITKVQPHYAVPTYFVSVDSFPETANGKIDKRALEALAQDSAAVQTITAPEPVVILQATMPETPITQEKDSNKSTSSLTTSESFATAKSIPSSGGTLVSLPLEKKIEPSALENQTSIWAGYEQDILPEKNQARWLRNLRHQIMYLYRRLFGIVFAINLGIFISVAVKGANSQYIGKIVVGNLFGAILMRQDYVIDAFFVIFTSIPSSWPLFIRRVAARVYHIGGLHSGAGASGTLWLILFAAQATREVMAGVGVSVLIKIYAMNTNSTSRLLAQRWPSPTLSLHFCCLYSSSLILHCARSSTTVLRQPTDFLGGVPLGSSGSKSFS
ncbi:hypothetical protein C0991_002473 [Blastosporella zonata]|nr:hypothetical protein C0991_002473 [Blastosporella zonata]